MVTVPQKRRQISNNAIQLAVEARYSAIIPPRLRHVIVLIFLFQGFEFFDRVFIHKVILVLSLVVGGLSNAKRFHDFRHALLPSAFILYPYGQLSLDCAR